MDGIRHKAIISLFSSYASQFAATSINFITKLVIARLLAPDDLGVYALALLVLFGGDMLMDLGISQHIVREKNRPYGNFLLLRLAVASILFVGIQIFAPIMNFWGAEFPSIIRVISVLFLIKAVSFVPTIYLDRELLIQKSLPAAFIKVGAMGLVSIVLAYKGLGVWSLVWGTIVAEVLYGLLIWNAVKHRITIELTFRYTWQLIWGSKFLFLIAVMGFALQQGDIAILGTLLTPREVGLYAMAYMLIVMISNVIESAVFRVIYPMFCEYSSEPAKLGNVYRRATLAIYAIETPIYFFLFFNASVIIPLVLGEKWLSAVLIVQVLSLCGIINPFCTFGNEVLRATKKDYILTLSTFIGALTLVTAGFILTSRYGVIGMAAANYIILGSIPTIIVVYRTIKADFIQLARELAVIYVSSFAVIALASMYIPVPHIIKTLIAGLLIPMCWYTYYRAFASDLGGKLSDTYGFISNKEKVASRE